MFLRKCCKEMCSFLEKFTQLNTFLRGCDKFQVWTSFGTTSSQISQILHFLPVRLAGWSK